MLAALNGVAQFLQSCKSLRDGTKVGAKPSVGPLLGLEELQGAVELAEQQSATMQQVAPLRAALHEQRELSTEQRKLRSAQQAPDEGARDRRHSSFKRVVLLEMSWRPSSVTDFRPTSNHNRERGVLAEAVSREISGEI